MVRRALCSQLPQLQAMLLAVTSVHPLCLVHSNAYSDEGPLPYKLQSRSLLLILFPLCGCGYVQIRPDTPDTSAPCRVVPLGHNRNPARHCGAELRDVALAWSLCSAFHYGFRLCHSPDTRRAMVRRAIMDAARHLLLYASCAVRLQ